MTVGPSWRDRTESFNVVDELGDLLGDDGRREMKARDGKVVGGRSLATEKGNCTGQQTALIAKPAGRSTHLGVAPDP